MEEEKRTIDKAAKQFTEEQKKFDKALEVAEGNHELAHKYLTGEIKNIAVIKGAFKEVSLKLYGLFLFFLYLDKESIDTVLTVVSFDDHISSISPYQKWSEMERNMVEVEWGDKNLVNQSQDLKRELKTAIGYEHLGKLVILGSDPH